MLIMDTGNHNVKAVPDETINEMYNATDIGINTSDGEGFGLCQIEHLFSGAPQIVTDVGSYRSFLDDTVAEFVDASGRTYMSGAMPLGGWVPTFNPNDLADAMEMMITTLPQRKLAAHAYSFKTWKEVCSDFLNDVRAASAATKAEIGLKSN
jgi:glycogen synthase